MDLFKGICLFLKIFVVTLLRITKKEGIVHHEPPKLLLWDWLLLQNHRPKIRKILFFSRIYNLFEKLKAVYSASLFHFFMYNSVVLFAFGETIYLLTLAKWQKKALSYGWIESTIDIYKNTKTNSPLKIRSENSILLLKNAIFAGK